MKQPNSYIEKLNWTTVRKDLQDKNPEIIKIIDSISPAKNFKIFKVKYPFGAMIVDYKEGFQLPNESGDIVPLSDRTISSEIANELSYSAIPFGIIVKNSIEIHRELNEKVFSLFLSDSSTGIEMGIWEFFGWKAPYSVCAGARSLYMVPWISLAGGHKRIKKELGIKSPAPHKLFDHWQIFKEIANSSYFNDKWHVEIIFLGRDWWEKINSKDKSFFMLREHILTKGWDHSAFARKKILFDFAWESIIEILNKRGIKTSAYIVDTVKHLLLILLGGLAASAPSCGNDIAGPITDIQKVYLEIYKLKDHYPTIMIPQGFNLNSQEPVYYSLQTPTLLSSTPGLKVSASNIDHIRELMEILSYFQKLDFIDIKTSGINFNDLLKNVDFNFFHGKRYAYGEIRPTTELSLNDKRFLYSPLSNDSEQRSFANDGAFVRGCIRIHTSKKQSTH